MDDGIDQRNQLAAQGVEQHHQIVAADPRLVAFQQRIVEVAGKRERFSLAPFQADDLFEPGTEAKIVGGSAGRGPFLLRQRRDPSQFLDQLARQARLAVVGPTNLADVDCLRPTPGRRRAASPRPPPTVRPAGRPWPVRAASRRGGRAARAVFRPGRRHERVLVPGQQFGARRQERVLLRPTNQLRVCAIPLASVLGRVRFGPSAFYGSPRPHDRKTEPGRACCPLPGLLAWRKRRRMS